MTQKEPSLLQKQIRAGVEFVFVTQSALGDADMQSLEEVARNMFDTALLYAKTTGEKPVEGDMHFLFEGIFQSLRALYPQVHPRDILERMKNVFTEE